MKKWREDFVKLDNVTIKDGILKATARIGRVGVQEYVDSDGTIVRELRTPTDIKNSVQSFSDLPITLNHPPSMINGSNADSLVKGFNSQCTYQDGWLISPIRIHKKDAIAAATTTHKQFSLGYWSELIEASGVWIDELGVQGEKGKTYPYDRIQTNHQGNHLALVTKARAGDRATFVEDAYIECRLDDVNNSIDGYTQELDNQETIMDKEKKTEQSDMGDLTTCDLGEYGCHTVPTPIAEILMKMKNKLSEMDGMYSDMSKYGDLFKGNCDYSAQELYDMMKPVMMGLTSGKCDVKKMCDMFMDMVRCNGLTIEIEKSEETMDKKDEQVTKIQSLEAELQELKNLLKERSDEKITQQIELETKKRLDAFNDASKFLANNIEFDAKLSALDWYKLAVEKSTEIKTDSMSEVEIKARFDMLKYIETSSRKKVEQAEEKLSQATSNQDKKEFQISYTLPQDKPCGMIFN